MNILLLGSIISTLSFNFNTAKQTENSFTLLSNQIELVNSNSTVKTTNNLDVLITDTENGLQFSFQTNSLSSLFITDYNNDLVYYLKNINNTSNNINLNSLKLEAGVYTIYIKSGSESKAQEITIK